MSILGYTVFSDDFNRADSGTVGNGWTESEVAAIVSNQLRIGDAASNNNAGVSRNLTTIGVMPYEMSGTFNISGGTRVTYFSPYFANASMSGLSLRLSLAGGNNVTIYDGAFGGGGTTLASVAFTINSATKYWFWINLTANGSNFDCNAYISSTSTKPGSPTITATNFSPSQTSGYTFVQIDGNNNTYTDIDFLTYLNSQPVQVDTNVTTDTQSYALAKTQADTNVTADTARLRYGWKTENKNTAVWTNQSKS